MRPAGLGFRILYLSKPPDRFFRYNHTDLY